MNLQDLINTVKAREGVSLDVMAQRAQQAGFSQFTKSQLSRAATEPLRAFPTRNMPAFAAALRVPLFEVVCACAESMFEGRFTFHMGQDGQSVIVSSAYVEATEDVDAGESLVVYKVFPYSEVRAER